MKPSWSRSLITVSRGRWSYMHRQCLRLSVSRHPTPDYKQIDHPPKPIPFYLQRELRPLHLVRLRVLLVPFRALLHLRRRRDARARLLRLLRLIGDEGAGVAARVAVVGACGRYVCTYMEINTSISIWRRAYVWDPNPQRTDVRAAAGGDLGNAELQEVAAGGGRLARGEDHAWRVHIVTCLISRRRGAEEGMQYTIVDR